MPFSGKQRIVITFVLSSVYQLADQVLLAIVSGDQEVRKSNLLEDLLPSRAGESLVLKGRDFCPLSLLVLDGSYRNSSSAGFLSQGSPWEGGDGVTGQPSE